MGCLIRSLEYRIRQSCSAEAHKLCVEAKTTQIFTVRPAGTGNHRSEQLRKNISK